jgi:hypothetical protein
LQEEGKQVLAGAIIDIILTGLLVISFIVNCLWMGKPLREKEQKQKNFEKKTYGRISDEKQSFD